MRYIAHKDGEREQSVKEHLEGTAERAGEFAEKFGKREWGYCCGMLHDIGKYSKEFQRKRSLPSRKCGLKSTFTIVGIVIVAPTDRSQSDCVHEQVAKADCECPFY